MRTAPVFIVLWALLLQLSAAAEQWTANVNEKKKIECNHGLQSADIITWKKDGNQIAYKDSKETKINPHYALEEKQGIVYLVIGDVQQDDAGSYTCAVFLMTGTRSYKTIEGQLEVKGAGYMLQSSITVMLFGCLLLAVLP